MAVLLNHQILYIGGFNMIKRIIDFIKYIIISCLVVFLFAGSYYALSNSFPNDGDVGDGDSFHNLPLNSIDVLVLGSSHAQCSFCPGFFYQDTGLYSYVLGSACQPLSISYKMLKECLKTQEPSTVILEVFTALPLKSMCEDISCYIIPSFIMTGEERYQTLRTLPQEKQDLYLNPFVASHNDWKKDDISFESIYEKTKNTIDEYFHGHELNIDEVRKSFGYIENYPTFPVENYWYATNTFENIDVELLPEDEQALNDIKKLCDEKNINLLLYKTPIDSLNDDNLSYLHKVWEWADNNQVSYIDFVEKSPEIGFYMCIHSDSFHSNISGANLITKEISKFVNDNFENNHVFNEGLEEKNISSESYYVLTYLDHEYDAKKYLPRLSNYCGPILIKYKKGKSNSSLKSFLNQYNITDSKICLYDNKELIDESDTCVGINYKDTDIYCDFSSMEIDGAIYNDLSDLTIVVFSKDMSTYKVVETTTKNMWKKGFNWYGE